MSAKDFDTIQSRKTRTDSSAIFSSDIENIIDTEIMLK